MKSSSRSLSRTRLGVVGAFTLATLAISVPSRAGADVRLEGDWAETDRPVSLDLSATPRGRAIELLAAKAGFSVVMSSPLGEPVDVHVKDQPASKVLALLLPNGSFVARRSANLVSIQAVDASSVATPAAPASPPPPPPPAPANAPIVVVASTSGHGAGKVGRGEDRTVMGGALTIEKGEVVHDVAVFGGRLDVYGTVTGDLAVLGGAAQVHEGAKVGGSATVLGGYMKVDDGAEVDHDVSVVGGHLDRGSKAKAHVATDDDDDDEKDDDATKSAEKVLDTGHEASLATRLQRAVSRWGDDALSSLSRAALLFVFGSVVVALATERSLALRVEIAARPMRSLALGLVGCIVSLSAAVALCVTIIGIPVAMVAAVVFMVAAAVGVSAVVATAGEALLRNRTANPYVHLAAGCALFFLVGLVPWLGPWVVRVVCLAGIGVVVATRGAGLIPRGRAVSYRPYEG